MIELPSPRLHSMHDVPSLHSGHLRLFVIWGPLYHWVSNLCCSPYIPLSSFSTMEGRWCLFCSLMIPSMVLSSISWAAGTILAYSATTFCAATALKFLDHLVGISANTTLTPSMWLMQNSKHDIWIAHLCKIDKTCLLEFGQSANGTNTYNRFLWAVNTCLGCVPQNR